MDYRGQPVQGGYPNGPYVPQSAPPQVITVPYFADAQTISRFQSEIDGLRFRLEQKTMKEYGRQRGYIRQADRRHSGCLSVPWVCAAAVSAERADRFHDIRGVSALL